jgi:peptidoglycan hydrolase-like protein with peptidoglycan-binding domain
MAVTTKDRTGEPRRRRRAWIAGATAAALVVAGGVAVVTTSALAEPAPVPKRLSAGSATIEKGDLSGSVSASGSLTYADPHDIGSGVSGVLTSAPQPGATVGLGQALFAVDNIPVFLFHGSLPQWRPFQSGMDDGPDVQQLEENLKALGYFDGQPDTEFTWSTKAAILAWQKATGQEQTGSIELGRIVFDRGDVRVQEVKAQVGGSVGGGAPVLSVTRLTKQVTVKLPLADQKLATVGGKVTIVLPDGTRTAGAIQSVGTPTQEGDQGGVIIPVVVSLDDPGAAGSLQQANVTVEFPSEKRENVLSVPVGALIALDGNRFGVEVIRKDGRVERIPVTTGLFAAGRVEISGSGIQAGEKVVVPKV